MANDVKEEEDEYDGPWIETRIKWKCSDRKRHNVVLYGSWNKFKGGDELEYQGKQVFAVNVKLPLGNNVYRFLIDGENWETHRGAPKTARNDIEYNQIHISESESDDEDGMDEEKDNANDAAIPPYLRIRIRNYEDGMDEEEDNTTEDYINSNDSKLTTYLIDGYIRDITAMNIIEMNKLCEVFYGLYHPHLVHDIYQTNANWFIDIKNKLEIFKYSEHKFKTYPLTQYIDDQYQIIYCGMLENVPWDSVAWKGFLCVNMKTNEICQIKEKLKFNKSGSYLSEIFMSPIKRSKNGKFHLKMSEALSLSETKMDGYKQLDYKLCWLEPKNNNDFEIDDGFKYHIWNEFEDNLWNLFVTDRLYDENKKDIKKNEIWNIIHLLSLIHFEDYHIDSLIIPQLILSEKTKKDKALNFPKDCYAKIIQYKKDLMLKCECYLYVDWADNWITQQMQRNTEKYLYSASFQIQKIQNVVDIELNFEIIDHDIIRGGRIS